MSGARSRTWVSTGFSNVAPTTTSYASTTRKSHASVRAAGPRLTAGSAGTRTAPVA
jgi:hypothetical protein